MRFELPQDEPQLIGRSSEALPISDTTVSRRHAELTPDEGEWYLRDLDSANGTFINGRRIAGRQRLQPGDQVRCGSTLFVFAHKEDDRHTRAVELLDADAFDVTVEGTSAANEESMVLASPDPSRAARDHLRVIYQLTALTASVFDRDELLNHVMDLVFDEFQPDRGFVLLQPSPEARPEPVVVRYKVKPKTLDEGRIPVSRTIVQHTLEKREGVLSTNAMNDSRFRSGDSVRDYGIRSAICVPIRAGDRLFGVIHIDSQLMNFTFTESQLQLMTAIGQHTGLAMLGAEKLSSRMHTERLAAMGQTVASLSHAIKNILQGLRGGADAVELAIKRGDLSLAEEGWPILSRNLDRIFTLTLNMLAYSKQRELEIELASLHGLIDEIAPLVQAQCDRKRIALMFDLADDMPPIPIDTGAMHQALMNMLTNAIEAAPPKTGVITVATRFDPERLVAEIRISDNGPGIRDEWRERVFQPFFSSKGQRGTGLGLAVTKKIIEEHGGRIELASPSSEDDEHDPRGAMFLITLPSDRAELSSGETRLPQPVSRDPMHDEFDDEEQVGTG